MDKKKIVVDLEKSGFTFDQPRPQTYSLPYGFSNYIFKNQTLHLYKRLVRSCKSIFNKRRILVVDTVNYSVIYCALDKTSISLEKLESSETKLWITHKLE